MKALIVTAMLACGVLALNAPESRAEEACLMSGGVEFCCGQRVLFKSGDQYWGGVIEALYSDGSAQVQWDAGGKDARNLSDLRLQNASELECVAGVCRGQEITYKVNGSYWDGTVQTVMSDGNVRVQWAAGGNDWRAASSLTLVNKVDCIGDFCKDDEITTHYDSQYWDGKVETVYSDG